MNHFSDSDAVKRFLPPTARQPAPERSAVCVVLRNVAAFLLSLPLFCCRCRFSSSCPDACLPVFPQDLSVTVLRPLASIADVTAHFPFRSARTDAHAATGLPFPLVSEWISPLSTNRRVVTYDQPARCMKPHQLQQLCSTFRNVAHLSVGCVPNHILFTGPHALVNRIVSVAYDEQRPLGFCAVRVFALSRAHTCPFWGLP